MRTGLVVGIGALLSAGFANAQQLPIVQAYSPAGSGAFIDPGSQFLAFNVARPDSGPGVYQIAARSVALPDFATYIGQQLGTPQVGAEVQRNSAALVSIASRLDRFTDRFREGIALAGAINVLPPNPGDRFAVSFGGAGYDGAGAGSIAISARLNDNTIAYLGYARGPTQNLVKGGVGFSFR